MDDAIITPHRNGPLIVRGRFRLVDQDGRPIETHRKTIALCRCGKSSIRPFCDGTHKRIDFKAPGGDTRPAPPDDGATAPEELPHGR